MSIDPSIARTPAAAVTIGVTPPGAATSTPGVPLSRVELLPLQPGDRLIVHVDAAAGMSAGGAHVAGTYVRQALKLDQLEFEVPVLVVAPGIRVTVARPG